MEQQATESIVREVMSKSSNTDGYENDQRTITDFAYMLNDPDSAVIKEDNDASTAANYIRVGLKYSYRDNVEAARVTCNLFYTLGRQNELGWIEEEVPGYRFEG